MKRKLFLLVNILFPLLLALIIYIFFGSGTYVNDFFDKFHFVREIREKNFFQGNIFFLVLRYYFCDFLWAYSLAFCVSLFIEKKDKRNLIVSFLFCSGFCAIWELIQFMGIVSGTFDFLDIIVEIFAVLTATLIIYKIWRKKL